ncbi:MAG: flagellar export chaperone FliS [Deltaproteobacteria bacterium HGW-Deltaproteobacteria-21]|nr:MAG: flagellar export chaperone FliS [Deltaproteobacteria bacterium HGW-Deltaproteobacteria-21]
MTYRKMLGEYRRLNVETAGKLDLVLMCYEKTIEVIRQGKEHLQEQEYEKKAGKIQKAIDIIHELQNCLNFEQGGQIARNLDSIYNYLVRRLLDGDLKKDAGAYDEVIGILSELKEAWEGVAKDRETNGIVQKTRTGLSLAQLAA